MAGGALQVTNSRDTIALVSSYVRLTHITSMVHASRWMHWAARASVRRVHERHDAMAYQRVGSNSRPNRPVRTRKLVESRTIRTFCISARRCLPVVHANETPNRSRSGIATNSLVGQHKCPRVDLDMRHDPEQIATVVAGHRHYASSNNPRKRDRK